MSGGRLSTFDRERFLDCDSVSVAYGNQTVVRDLSLSMGEGQFFSLLGPSGCGKTTLLRVIAGLSQATSGTVRLSGEDITNVPAYKRNFGVVFQNYALFPHLDVEHNVAFGLMAHGMGQAEALKIANQQLQLVQLADMGKRRIDALSGGQQQRVAVARALATKPRLLLLDEPFSALDRKLRVELQVELRRLLREIGMTTLFVTHDQSEAFALSDRIAVIRKGVIEQIDTPSNLYNRPQSQFVLDFVGLATQLHGRVVSQEGDTVAVVTRYGSLRVNATFAVGAAVKLAIRPERVSILGDEVPSAENEIVLPLRDRVYLGGEMLLSLDAEPPDVVVATALEGARADLVAGHRLRLFFPPEHLIVLPANS